MTGATIAVRVKILPIKKPNEPGQWTEHEVPENLVRPRCDYEGIRRYVLGEHCGDFFVYAVELIR